MTDADHQNPLTDRQMEILTMVTQGVTNREIGQALNISENTVRKHLQNIFEKLEVSSRTEATTLAYQRGWVTLPTSVPSSDAQTVQARLDEVPQPAIRVDARLLAAVGVVVVAVVALVTWLVVTRQPTPAVGETTVPATDLDRWSDAPPLSTPRTGLAVTAFNGSLYAIAGETAAGPTGLTERFEPDDGLVRRLADKPTPVRDVGAAVVGGKIYVPGGCLDDDLPTDVLEVYDPETDEWSARATLPQGVCAYAIAAHEGKLYIFGGWDGKGYANHTLVYDPDDNRWSQARPMPTARGYAGAGAVEGQIYVVGGYDGQRDLAIVEAYAPSKDQAGDNPWTPHTALPDGRAGAGVVALRSTLYIIGGGWDKGRETTVRYDVLSDTWELGTSPTTELWRNMGVAVLDVGSETRIYAVGGWAGDYVAANRAYTALYNVMLLPLQQQ
jgi:DNA-binding CsgD family transcriptional regulator